MDVGYRNKSKSCLRSSTPAIRTTFPPQPHSLQFLCKGQILLSSVLPHGMPTEGKKFNSMTKQAVVVKVWSSTICSWERDASCGVWNQDQGPRPLVFRWLVWERLGLPTTSLMTEIIKVAIMYLSVYKLS